MGALTLRKTTAELYPPKTPTECLEITGSIVEAKTANGTAWVLRRALTLNERKIVEARKAVLDKWMVSGSHNAMKLAINEMFQGFGDPDRTEDERDSRNANFAHACHDRTIWAVERACMRFRMGEVQAEEIGEKSITFNFRPTSAHLNRLAKNIEEPTRAEHELTREILRGHAALGLETPRRLDLAEGARQQSAAVAAHMTQRRATRDLEETERQLRQEAESADLRRREFETCNDTYRRAGLEPPQWLPGQIPVSLDMKLKHGWRIEAGPDGTPILTAPHWRGDFAP